MTKITPYNAHAIRQNLGGLVSPADADWLANVSPELSDAWAKQQRFRTETEMRVAVLTDLEFPTAAAKYWQAVREQATMIEQLVLMGFEYRRLLIDIEDIEERVCDSILTKSARLKLFIDLDEKRYQKAAMEAVAADRVREIRLWAMIKAELNDGSFDTIDPGAHQLESLRERFRVKLEAGGAAATFPELCNLVGQLRMTEKLMGDAA